MIQGSPKRFLTTIIIRSRSGILLKKKKRKKNIMAGHPTTSTGMTSPRNGYGRVELAFMIDGRCLGRFFLKTDYSDDVSIPRPDVSFLL